MQKRIGDIFVEKGILTEEQLTEALAYAQKHGIRLGDAAVKMDLIDAKILLDVFGQSNREDFFYVDCNYFPPITKNLFDLKSMLKYGVLPLGFKSEVKLFKSRKLLNLGLVSPERQSSIIPDLERLAKEKIGENTFQEIKVYLILAEQFFEVMEQIYETSEADIRESNNEIDERLIIYLDSGSKILSTKFMQT